MRWGIAGVCAVGAAGVGLLARLFAAQPASSGAVAWWVLGVFLIAALVVVIATLVLLPRRAS